LTSLGGAFRAAVATSLALSVLAAAGAAWARAHTGLALEVRTPAATVTRPHAPLDARVFEGVASPATARWTGLWEAGAGEERRVSVRSDGGVWIRIDGQEVVARKAGARNARTDATFHALAGRRAIEVEVEGPARDLRVRMAGPDGVFHDVPRSALTTDVPSPPARAMLRAADALPRAAGATWAIAALLGLALLARETTPRARRVAVACALAVFALGAALRFEALLDRYWVADRPAWADAVLPALRVLHPADLRWEPPEVPYEGDPYAYLRHARAMRHFYEARFREPFFVGAAKVGVSAAGGRDLGISLASMAFSALSVLAVYALGAAAFSPVVGLVAAAGLAIDRWMIQLSVEGWRDDTFAFWVVVTALGALKVYDHGGWRWAMVLGVALAAATLTRITAFTLAAPVLACLAFVPRARPRRERLRVSLVAAGVFLTLVTPFLVTSWIAYGDPFHSINAVAPAYYVSTEPSPEDASVGHYLRTRLRPFEMLDSVLVGYTVYPFAGKWRFDEWWPRLGRILATLSVLGAALLLASPRGRLLWVVWAGALFPFVFTWQVPGGNAPRLTTFAYPFYLIAAGVTVWAALRALVAPAFRARVRDRVRAVPVGKAAAAALVLLVLGWAGVRGLFFLSMREALAAGRAATIAAGPRDAMFFRDGWSRPIDLGNLSVRRMGPSGARIAVPLRAGRDHHFLFRLDPVDPARMPRPSVRVAMNGATLGTLPLAFDAKRFGTYELDAPAAAVQDGENVLELSADAPIALWYVRIVPEAPTGLRPVSYPSAAKGDR
jgi:dolichyl-phosphate-mannose-protein mannosyltransferase